VSERDRNGVATVIASSRWAAELRDKVFTSRLLERAEADGGQARTWLANVVGPLKPRSSPATLAHAATDAAATVAGGLCMSACERLGISPTLLSHTAETIFVPVFGLVALSGVLSGVKGESVAVDHPRAVALFLHSVYLAHRDEAERTRLTHAALKAFQDVAAALRTPNGTTAWHDAVTTMAQVYVLQWGTANEKMKTLDLTGTAADLLKTMLDSIDLPPRR
jgi:hypothetical protein